MKKIFSLLVALLAIASSYAVPARPGWQTKTQPDGTTIEVQLMGDEFYHYWINRDGQTVQVADNGYWQVLAEQPAPAAKAAKRKAAAKKTSYKKIAKAPTTGSPRGLVILVNFKDLSFQSANTQSAMNDMMNSDNYTHNGATGSVAKYFADQSNGQYTPVFDVVGPVTLPYSMSHYGANDSEGNDLLPGDMVVEACSIANVLHNVDFTRYDNDYDGYLDFVYIIYAGKGEADGGSANTVWPHSWDVYSAEYFGNCSYNESKRMFDGRYIYQYACSGELDGPTGKRAGIGTIAHEFSHVIGLPDLYDIDYGQNYKDEMTPGVWHLMDHGSYNNDGRTPPSYTIYDKYFLGWATPTNPGNTAQVLTLNANEGYQLASSNSLLASTSTNTVYYIENRQNSGWDTALPGHGMLVWKIMYNQTAWNNNGPNDTNGTIRYALVSASGKTTEIGSAVDPFPGTGNKTSWTTLSSKPLKDITEKNGVITLTYIEKPATEDPTDPEEPTEPETPSGTVTFDADVDTGNASFDATNQTAYTVSKDGITMDVTKGIIGTYNNENHYRVYKSETLTLTSTVGNIVKVEFTCTANDDAKYGPGCFTWSTGDYTYSGAVGTWSGSENTITFTASTNQVRATQIMVTLSGSDPEEPTDPEDPTDPEEPEVNTNITGLQYADAYYYEYDGVGYWDLDMYKDFDMDTYEYIYPEVYVSIQANSKTALNGTYELLYAGYWTSVEDSVEMDYDLPATITIQNTDNEGNYSVKGTFVGTDGLTYTFDDVVNVWAFDYDNWEEITLDESGEPTDPEDPTDPEEPTEPETPSGTVTFDADVDTGNASFDATNQTAYTVSKDGITMDVTKGIIGTYNNENHYRVYKSQTLTLTSTVGNIVSVEFTCTANDDAKYGPGCFTWSTGDYTYSGAVGTWSGSAKEISFTASTNQVRATQIVVTIAGTATGVENAESATPAVYKILRDGQLLIICNGKTYGVDGQEIGK